MWFEQANLTKLVHKENNTFGYAIIKKMANHLASKSSRITVEHVFSNNVNIYL